MDQTKELFTFLKKYKKILLIAGIPFIAGIIPIYFRNLESYCAYILIIMSLYWTTECLPIGVTSLIPIVLFPLFGIMSSKTITVTYFQDIIFLFFGGLVMANAIEISNLHERISLKVLIYFGSNPKWLLLGFMTITAFMSAWISNAAACSMMLPMINAVVSQLVLNDKSYHSIKEGEINEGLESSVIELNKLKNSTKSLNETKIEDLIKYSPKARNLSTCFLLSCSYSSTVGGLGSLVGTAPNILLKGYFDENYPTEKLTFLSFSLFAFPVSIILIIVSWLWLCFRWLPREYLFDRNKEKNENEDDYLSEVIMEKYEKLGPISWDQICVGVLFLNLVILWITRDMQGLFGWGNLFNSKYVTDTTPAILTVVLLFACPKKNIFKGHDYEHLISWKQLQDIFPWSVILLIGGGLAIAEGFQRSGLSHQIGENLKGFVSSRKEITLFIIIFLSATCTEFTSNTSMASILLPIVDSIAQEMNISPPYLLLPLILSVSLAFMLPVATPTNALIFANGSVRMKDMITTGVVMNIIGLLTIFIAANTWLGLLFNTTPSIPININANLTNMTHN